MESSAARQSMFVRMRRQDPVLIVFQILALQCLYYAALGAFYICCHLLYGMPLHMDRFFATAKTLDFRSTSSGLELLGVLAGGFAGAGLLCVVVEKSRKCLDFAVTMHACHLAACLAYSELELPHWTWWLCHGSALVVMIVLGEYLCSRRELQDIPLAG